MPTNPFKVLGLAPSALKGLTDPQIDQLVQALFREQSRIHHTDLGGKKKAFQKFEEARSDLDQLRNGPSYQYWKAQYLKQRRDQGDDTEKLLTAGEQKRVEAESRLIDFWQALARCDQEESPVSIFNVQSARLLILDKIRFAQLQRLHPQKITLPLYTFDLEIDQKGNLIKFPLDHVRFNANQTSPPPDIQKGWVSRSASKGKHSYYFRRTGEKEALSDIRLIGTIPEKLRHDAGGDRAFFRPLLEHESAELDFAPEETGFGWDSFRAWAVHMSPYLQPLSVLIGMQSRPVKRFFVLGQIREIIPLS